MLDVVILLAFGFAVAALVYTYLGYPLGVWWLSRRFSVPVARGALLPSVTVVVIAHNEADQIRRRLLNLLQSDYPSDKLRILVASDGSTDATAKLARDTASPRVRVKEFARARGKPAVLSELVPNLATDYVVFADARQEFAPDAIRQLLSNFSDPDVGAVSGELKCGSLRGGLARGVGVYWRYEKMIRSAESRMHSCVGVTGAIYALRTPLFRPIPDDILLDDVWIPMQVVRSGYRVIFEPRAVAYDPLETTPEREMQRKVRTIAGTFQWLARQRWVLSPRHNPIWLQSVSHKGMRLAGPVFLAIAFGTNAALAGPPLFTVLFGMQLAFYSMAAGGWLLQKLGRHSRFLAVPYAFCHLNVATVVAFWRYVAGTQSVAWKVAGRRSSTAHVPWQ